MQICDPEGTSELPVSFLSQSSATFRNVIKLRLIFFLRILCYIDNIQPEMNSLIFLKIHMYGEEVVVVHQYTII
jgi:hypothetical protein